MSHFLDRHYEHCDGRIFHILAISASYFIGFHVPRLSPLIYNLAFSNITLH